ncbi:Hypothetical predicted protein [Paramuricea clavata]|uniref:Uncharacterized protein n=1 Tax=Paramuricea clavata TaxID=317549 RepID=A0A7D9IWB5_PARCT|nr:Hypothetical predicted protein [Paramuricea clavata]
MNQVKEKLKMQPRRLNHHESQSVEKKALILHLEICVVSDLISDVVSDLSSAFDKGNEAFTQLVSNKLLVEEPDIFSTIPKMKLKTFDALNKPVSRMTWKGQVVSLRTDRNTLARLFVIGQKRSIDVQQMLSFCLGSCPLSLATVTGGICKTTKAKLLQSFQSEFLDCIVDNFHDACCVLIDAMAVLQSTVLVPETYGELADDILVRVLAVARKFKASRVEFVSDRYPAQSIKNAQREKRVTQGECSVRIYAKDQKVFKLWKKFLSNGKNKENLVSFLLDTWSNMEGRHLGEHELFVTSGSNCTKLSSTAEILHHDMVIELSDCDYEEADTRLMLHAAHAAKCGHQTIVIKSPDTDVCILGLYSKISLPETSLFLYTGSGEHSRILSLDVISSSIPPELSSALPGLHAFTGCDYTSSFFGKGKAKALKLARSNEHFLQAFSEFGSTEEADHKAVTTLDKFTCSLFGDSKAQTVNDARYNLFTQGKFEIGAPHFRNHGWEVDESGKVSVKWLSGLPAMDNILESSSCKCKTGCKTKRCGCKKEDLECTELCFCCDCQNQKYSNADEDDDDFYQEDFEMDDIDIE